MHGTMSAWAPLCLHFLHIISKLSALWPQPPHLLMREAHLSAVCRPAEGRQARALKLQLPRHSATRRTHLRMIFATSGAGSTCRHAVTSQSAGDVFLNTVKTYLAEQDGSAVAELARKVAKLVAAVAYIHTLERWRCNGR